MAELTIDDKTFQIAPHIGHCLTMQKNGVDLLGVAGDPQFEKLVADPVGFLTILETLIADQAGDDARFVMPTLASYMLDGKWTECRKVVLDAFHGFFQDNGYQPLALGLERMQEAADMVTERVSKSLESGELRTKMETLIDETLAEAEALIAG